MGRISFHDLSGLPDSICMLKVNLPGTSESDTTCICNCMGGPVRSA